MNRNDASPDDLDQILDAALKMHLSAEPRPGLEDRVFANLRSEECAADRSWWAWGFAVALALIVLALGIGWRTTRPHLEVGKPTISFQPNRNVPKVPVVLEDPGGKTQRTVAHHAVHSVRRSADAQRNPKLERFPASRPLDEQEQMLAQYVAQFHEEAVIVARVRSEAQRLDREEEMQESDSGSNQNSQVR